MCALQPGQQPDHDVFKDTPQIVLNEVIVLYKDGSASYELSLNPDDVSVMFWNDERRQEYLGTRAKPSGTAISSAAQHASFIISATKAQPPENGIIPGLLYFQLDDGSVYVTPKPVTTWLVIALYHSPLSKKNFEVELPTYSVDALFWNSAICERFRAASRLQGPHNLFKPNGSRAHARNAYDSAYFMPRPLTRQPKFASTSCKLCYHYEGCQWACTVDAP